MILNSIERSLLQVIIFVSQINIFIRLVRARIRQALISESRSNHILNSLVKWRSYQCPIPPLITRPIELVADIACPIAAFLASSTRNNTRTSMVIFSLLSRRPGIDGYFIPIIRSNQKQASHFRKPSSRPRDSS